MLSSSQPAAAAKSVGALSTGQRVTRDPLKTRRLPNGQQVADEPDQSAAAQFDPKAVTQENPYGVTRAAKNRFGEYITHAETRTDPDGRQMVVDRGVAPPTAPPPNPYGSRVNLGQQQESTQYVGRTDDGAELVQNAGNGDPRKMMPYERRALDAYGRETIVQDQRLYNQHAARSSPRDIGGASPSGLGYQNGIPSANEGLTDDVLAERYRRANARRGGY